MSEHQPGTGQVYKGRGVWVPEGLTAAQIMEGAWALERQFDVAPFISRLMAAAVLEAAGLSSAPSDKPPFANVPAHRLRS